MGGIEDATALKETASNKNHNHMLEDRVLPTCILGLERMSYHSDDMPWAHGQHTTVTRYTTTMLCDTAIVQDRSRATISPIEY